MARRRHRRRRDGSPVSLALLGVLLLAGSLAAAYWYLSDREALGEAISNVPLPVPTDVASAILAQTPEPQAPVEPAFDDAFVPDPPLGPSDLAPASLDESDDAFRERLGQSTAHPLALQVLRRSDLIRTLVTATLEVSEGRSPRKRFAYLAPEAPFETRGDLLYLRPDPDTYARYDGLVEAFVRLDGASVVRTYKLFEPLFDEAYAELGYPGEDFDDALLAAIDTLLAVPIVTREPALIPRAKTFAYEDPSLEGLAPVQRHLLRTGPRNVERVQSKLRELRRALVG